MVCEVGMYEAQCGKLLLWWGKGLANCLLTAVAGCFYNPFFLQTAACNSLLGGAATKFPDWKRLESYPLHHELPTLLWSVFSASVNCGTLFLSSTYHIFLLEKCLALEGSVIKPTTRINISSCRCQKRSLKSNFRAQPVFRWIQPSGEWRVLL